MRQKRIAAEIRAELVGHSFETTMKHSSPKQSEIERAVGAIDDASTIYEHYGLISLVIGAWFLITFSIIPAGLRLICFP